MSTGTVESATYFGTDVRTIAQLASRVKAMNRDRNLRAPSWPVDTIVRIPLQGVLEGRRGPAALVGNWEGAAALLALGIACCLSLQLSRAETHLAAVRDIAQSNSQHLYYSWSLFGLGLVALLNGDMGAASVLKDVLRENRATGDARFHIPGSSDRAVRGEGIAAATGGRRWLTISGIMLHGPTIDRVWQGRSR